MAKKQTRRSISVRGVTYLRLRDYCGSQSMSISDFIEQRIAGFFTAHGETEAPRPAAQPLAVAAARRPEPAARPVEKKALTSVPREAPRSLPVQAPPPPRAVPAASAINRPLPVAARRSVAPALAPLPAPAPKMVATVAAAPSSIGRPAPTPAADVIKERSSPPSPGDVKDYRAIRF